MQRTATHAGSWYSDRPKVLDDQLTRWLASVPAQLEGGVDLPAKKLRAIIAPHAGYRYSGSTAAYAYRAIDAEQFDRVFVLGPSHHFYLDGCGLSRCSTYETPLGDLPVDQNSATDISNSHTTFLTDHTAMEELRQTGTFNDLQLTVEEDEHSIEMHLPYIRKIFSGRNIQIVPIMVGSIGLIKEKRFGAILSPYLADPRTLFVISSDFSHWGSRFNYTYYRDSGGQVSHLSRQANALGDTAIYENIEALDRRGMQAIASPRARDAHDAFAAYLSETRNTICGRHPIGILLAAMAAMANSSTRVQFIRYEQSGRCTLPTDSSVSYASAIITSE